MLKEDRMRKMDNTIEEMRESLLAAHKVYEDLRQRDILEKLNSYLRETALMAPRVRGRVRKGHRFNYLHAN